MIRLSAHDSLKGKDMDIDTSTIQYQRYQHKRQQFKPVLRTLIDGLASLIDGSAASLKTSDSPLTTYSIMILRRLNTGIVIKSFRNGSAMEKKAPKN